MDLTELTDEAIPLIAADIRTARTQLGITPAQAAKRVRLSKDRYRALEKGPIPRTQNDMPLMILAAGRLGLKSVRICISIRPKFEST